MIQYGLRQNDFYFADPYGNVATYENERFCPTNLKESDVRGVFSRIEDPIPYYRVSWPFRKGKESHKIINPNHYYQEWLTGHVYKFDGAQLSLSDTYLSNCRLKSEDLVQHKVPQTYIPLEECAIEPRDVDAIVYDLNSALSMADENQWAFKIAGSGNRLYARGDYVLSYTADRITPLRTSKGFRREGWFLIKEVPESVKNKYQVLIDSKAPPSQPESNVIEQSVIVTPEIIKSAPDIKVEGNLIPDRLVEMILETSKLSNKLIDSGRVDEGAKLAGKLGYLIGHVSWNMRGE